jgi:hypothetical protein
MGRSQSPSLRQPPLSAPRANPESRRGRDQRLFLKIGQIGGSLDRLAALRTVGELLAHQRLGALRRPTTPFMTGPVSRLGAIFCPMYPYPPST